MANTLTGLIPILYESEDVVPREFIGLIQSVTADPSEDMAAVGQTIRSHVVPAMAAVNITPGVTNTNAINIPFTYVDLIINSSKAVPFAWTGEEQKGVGSQYGSLFADEVKQAIRTLSNQVELALVQACAAGASFTAGTPGTTPFGETASLVDFGNAGLGLNQNGAPQDGRSLILGPIAMANLWTQPNMTAANEYGSPDFLQNGYFRSPINSFAVRMSNQIDINGKNTAGTGSGYVVTSGPLAAGSTTVTVGTGTGTILAGDTVTIGAQTYEVATALSAGSFTIDSPGLKTSTATNATVTVAAGDVKNIILQKAGVLLATRQPAMPLGGDAASDVAVFTDPVSGISFQICMYRQYRQVTVEVGLAWGVKVLRSDYVGILAG
jgi:hypothetical protein